MTLETFPTLRDSVTRDVFIVKDIATVEITESVDTAEDMGLLLTETGLPLLDERGRGIYGD